MIDVIIYNDHKERDDSFEAAIDIGGITGYGKNEKKAKERLKELVKERIKELNDLIKQL